LPLSYQELIAARSELASLQHIIQDRSVHADERETELRDKLRLTTEMHHRLVTEKADLEAEYTRETKRLRDVSFFFLFLSFPASYPMSRHSGVWWKNLGFAVRE
jgi:hypothetical protein